VKALYSIIASHFIISIIFFATVNPWRRSTTPHGVCVCKQCKYKSADGGRGGGALNNSQFQPSQGQKLLHGPMFLFLGMKPRAALYTCTRLLGSYISQEWCKIFGSIVILTYHRSQPERLKAVPYSRPESRPKFYQLKWRYNHIKDKRR
jgi:hypothetical protein